VVAAGSAALACGPSTQSEPVIEMEEASEVLAERICGLADSCGCYDRPDAGTLAECRIMTSESWDAEFEEGNGAGLTYDGACLAFALQDYESVGCATGYEDGSYENEENCEAYTCKFFYGTKQVGEPCTLTEPEGLWDDCAQGLYCGNDGCYDPCEKAGPGESCDYNDCEEGLACQGTSTPDGGQEAYCVVGVKEGESCADQPCTGLTVCSDDQVCVPFPGPGDPCVAASFCDFGNYCDQGTCRAYKDAGESCMAPSECSSGECSSGSCTEPLPIACF
jgi:hypothetical protein